MTGKGISLDVKYEWEPVESLPGTAYRFPCPVTPRMTQMYGKPAVYRWIFYSEEGRAIRYYFGETRSLAGRIKQYLSPGKSQQTNIRMNEHLCSHSKLGLAVGIDVLRPESIVMNDRDLSVDGLKNGFVRKAIENLLIAEFEEDATVGIQLLNRPTAVSDEQKRESLRKVRTYLKGLPVEERMEILRKAAQ
ncbi:MAG TPA: hypothetical protein VKS44_04485 [Candidatus Acidoferrales bacterium]|nr:hypothetical protein [Candidatus Acidoferrales bacterium]